MDIKLSKLDGVQVYQVSGEINIQTSAELKKAFDKTIDGKIVVDLEKVSYVDSSGLATLVELQKKIKAQNGHLALSGVTDKVKSLFEITKLDSVFTIFPNQKDAVTKLKA